MLHRYLTGLLVLIFATLAVPDATKQRTDTKQKQSTTSSAEMRLKKAVEGTEDVRPHSPENTTPLTLGCSSSYCNDRELRKKYTINNIQKEILSKLNMKNPPNVTGKNLTFRAGMYDLISRTHPASYPRPVLHHTVDMQNDDPSTYSSSVLYAEEEEEAQFLPKTILISPSKERKYLLSHFDSGILSFKEYNISILSEYKKNSTNVRKQVAMIPYVEIFVARNQKLLPLIFYTFLCQYLYILKTSGENEILQVCKYCSEYEYVSKSLSSFPLRSLRRKFEPKKYPDKREFIAQR